MARSKTPYVRTPDPIRIVPLHGQGKVLRALGEAAPAPAPRLTYRKGPLIAAVEVFTIFWGAAWKTSPQNTLIGRLNAFFDFVLTSPLIDQLSEYNAGGYKIAHGRRTGTATITTGLRGTSITDTAIQAFLTQHLGKSGVPKATASSLYFIYVAPGVRVVMGGSASCQAFCGYHSDIGGKTFYAVMPYPGCTGCTGDAEVFDALTSTSSHELCEAITDPVPGSGWYDDANGEIADICAWQTRRTGDYVVQLEWSNKAGKCL
jgi:hypothetical protein